MSGRRLLAALIAAAMPAWQVVSDARAIDSVRRSGAAVLWTSRRSRLDKLGLDWLQDEVTVWIVTGVDKPEDIEDDLDDLLLDLMAALEPADSYVWSDAERGVLAEKFQGWRMTVTCVYQIETEG